MVTSSRVMGGASLVGSMVTVSSPVITRGGIVQPRYGVGTPTNPATPFTQMPSFKKLGTDRDVKNAKTSGDGYLESLIIDQGWSNPKLRTVTSSADVDNAVKAGAVELFRTVSADRGKTAKQLLDEFRYEEVYGGYGIYGNGTYTATSLAHSKNTYGGYGMSETIRMALKPGARIVDWSDLQQMAVDNRTYHDSLNVPRINGKSPFRPLAHLANLAVWLGYDAIRKVGGNNSRSAASGGHDYYNILNPTAVVIEDINVGQPKTGYKTP